MSSATTDWQGRLGAAAWLIGAALVWLIALVPCFLLYLTARLKPGSAPAG
jgi:hypothetical protein